MNILIAGAGEVGRHSAQVLSSSGHQITLIDRNAEKLDSVGEALDVRTLAGSVTQADTLIAGGIDKADLFIAATDADQTNMLSASFAKALGAQRAIARVHHRVFHERVPLDYAAHFNVDWLVCPEHLTSLAIAGVLRDPALQAIEHFARGRIVMERIEVGDTADVVGRSLKELALPNGVRIGTVSRQGRSIVPNAHTVLNGGDQVTLVGTTKQLDKLLPMLRRDQQQKQKIVIFGGSPTSVWLARGLDKRFFKTRLYVNDRARAEELSEKLEGTTVLDADPTDPAIFEEENIGDADAFVGATSDDEDNILGALQASHLGVKRVMVVVSRFAHHTLIEGLGIDHVFSPRIIASRAIEQLAVRQTIHEIARLDEHGTGVYELDVGPESRVTGKTVKDLQLPPGVLLIAVERGDEVRVPGPDDTLQADDTVIAIAHQDLSKKLRTLFD